MEIPENCPEYHPVQFEVYGRKQKHIPRDVALAAYEVYCHIFRPQESMITGRCRGGFGIMELAAYLYARSFPRDQWRTKVDEALDGMQSGDNSGQMHNEGEGR